MSHLAKLTIKSVLRPESSDPVQHKRNKLLSAIEQQLKVAEATAQGKKYAVTIAHWSKNDQGERVRNERQRTIRPWFFAQDGGFYVQCRCNSKPLPLSKEGDSVFVKQFSEVPSALQALYAAVAAGELDIALTSAAKRKVTN